MTINVCHVLNEIEKELSAIKDNRVTSHIRSLLIEPAVVMREWEYGTAGLVYPSLSILNHLPSNTGITYCASGFGPKSPWGLVFLTGPSSMSFGMDSSWYDTFLNAYFDSMASAELPIWRVFRQDGDHYPGVVVTDESDWDSTWAEVKRRRIENPTLNFNCSHNFRS